MVKVAISGYYGFKNFGDELILSVLIKKLKSLGADITVFSVNPEFTKKAYDVNAERTFNLFSVVKNLWETDVLISGGGSLFQDVTSINSLIYYAFVLGFAQILNKKTIIFAQGIGPLNNPISRFIVKTLFRKVNSITVRDEKSLNLLKNWKIDAICVDDPAFGAEIPFVKKTNNLGIQLRGKCNMPPKFLPNLARAVAQSQFNTVKIFSLQNSLDMDMCKKFKQLLNDFAPEKQVYIVNDNLVREIASLNTLVGMRFHALIIGIKSKVKCTGINYDPKINSLCQEFNLEQIEFSDASSAILEKINSAKLSFISSEKGDFELNL